MTITAVTIARRGAVRALALLSLVVLLGACSATFRNHGYVPPQEDLDQIAVGVDTRASVSDLVGPPTSSGVLNDSGYYYVRSRMRNFAFTAPRVVDRQVVAITFDGEGVVENIQRFGLEDGRVIVLERRVTETNVTDSTFLRQLLRNLGRFAASNAIE